MTTTPNPAAAAAQPAPAEPFKHIVVALDGSPLAEKVLPYVETLARRSRARVTLLCATHPSTAFVTAPEGAVPVATTIIDPLEIAEDERRAIGAYLADVVRRLKERGTEVGVEQPEGAPAEELLRYVGTSGADLIAMTTHGRGGLGRLVFGSVADEVLRQAPCPVLVVPSAAQPVAESARSARVLVTLDGSEEAAAVLEQAVPFARLLDGELLLLRVVELPTFGLYGDGSFYLPIQPEEEIEHARTYLEEVAEHTRTRAPGMNVAVHAATGYPATTIAELARDLSADYLAMATHGRSGLARLVLGSVTSGTLQRVTVPLLLVRPVAPQEASGA